MPDTNSQHYKSQYGDINLALRSPSPYCLPPSSSSNHGLRTGGSNGTIRDRAHPSTDSQIVQTDLAFDRVTGRSSFASLTSGQANEYSPVLP